MNAAAQPNPLVAMCCSFWVTSWHHCGQQSRALCCHGSLQLGGSVAQRKGRGAWWWGGRRVIGLLAFVSPSSVQLCTATYAADLAPASQSDKAWNSAKMVCHACDDLDCNSAKMSLFCGDEQKRHCGKVGVSASRKSAFNVTYLCVVSRKKRAAKSKPFLLGSFLWSFLLTKANFQILGSSYGWGQ